MVAGERTELLGGRVSHIEELLQRFPDIDVSRRTYFGTHISVRKHLSPGRWYAVSIAPSTFETGVRGVSIYLSYTGSDSQSTARKRSLHLALMPTQDDSVLAKVTTEYERPEELVQEALSMVRLGCKVLGVFQTVPPVERERFRGKVEDSIQVDYFIRQYLRKFGLLEEAVKEGWVELDDWIQEDLDFVTSVVNNYNR